MSLLSHSKYIANQSRTRRDIGVMLENKSEFELNNTTTIFTDGSSK